jgi:hypothetical protein
MASYLPGPAGDWGAGVKSVEISLFGSTRTTHDWLIVGELRSHVGDLESDRLVD